MEKIAEKISGGFAGRRVVVVGDPVADQFLRGTIGRVSREAPVFILRHDETETLPGGAANAAANIASLGAQAVLVGVVGDDVNGAELKASLQRRNVDVSHLLTSSDATTTTKVRVLAGQHYARRQQVIRIDYEGGPEYSGEIYQELRRSVDEAVSGADAVIVSDYSYGSATPEVGRWCAEAAQRVGARLLVDSRTRLDRFRDGSATPNQEEVENLLGPDFEPSDCEALRESLGFESLLITMGNKGMTLIEPGCTPLEMPAIGSSEPVDVTGAGDTVIAAYALGLSLGMSFREAATMANHAGGIVVMKRGTATVGFDELVASVRGADRLGTTGSGA